MSLRTLGWPLYCARAYNVEDEVEAAGVGLLDEYS